MHTNYRIFTFLILVVLFSNTSIAQPLLGAQLGLNIANLPGDKEDEETMPRIGLSPYITLDFTVSSLLTIETGVAYSMQGMKRTRIVKDDVSITKTVTKYNVDYLIVPVYLKENFTNFYAKIGPYGAYPINPVENWEESVSVAGVTTTTKGTNLEFKNEINQYDVGVSIGFGYIHYLSKNRARRHSRRKRTTNVIQIDLKYNFGLIPLDKTGNNPDLNLKNRVFTIGVSINSIYD